MRQRSSSLEQRRSVRNFLTKPLAKEQVEHVLTRARWAASGANLQPGQIHALSGQPLHALCNSLQQAYWRGDQQPEEYSYFPNPMPSLLKARQRQVGMALYDSLGIARRDLDARRAQHARNFAFFDAPVGLIVTLDSRLGAGCYMDLGMFLQNIFLAAYEEGLGSCGLGALASYPKIIRQHLPLGHEDVVICGIALGYANANAPENQWPRQRAPLDEYATFIGFE